jgi:hypothetical protein
MACTRTGQQNPTTLCGIPAAHPITVLITNHAVSMQQQADHQQHYQRAHGPRGLRFDTHSKALSWQDRMPLAKLHPMNALALTIAA